MPRAIAIDGGLEESSGTDSFRRPKPVEVPDLEAIFEAKRDAINSDELKHLLLPPKDEIKVQDIERLSRTIDSSVPENTYEQTNDLFARKCIEFYSGGWNIVERKDEGDRVPSPTLVPLVYESDLKHAHKSSAQDLMHELANISSKEILNSSLLCSRAESRDTSDTPVKGQKKEPAVSLKAKAKKRVVVFRFKTERGPPILEFAKDDKRAHKEELDLSASNSIEYDDNSTDTFVINFDEGAYVFQCEDMATREKWVSTVADKVNLWRRVVPQANGGADVPDSPLEPSPQRFSLKNTRGPKVDTKSVFLDLSQSRSPQDRKSLRSRLARPDLLAVYQVDDAAPLSKPIPPPPHMSEYLGHRFVVTCQDLTMRMNLSANGRPLNPEPFFCSLVLYDIRENCVVSERFHFDLNQQRHGYCEVDTSAAHLETRSRRAVFSVSDPHPEIYLVLFVEKTLQKDFNAVIEAYIRGADNPKAAERQSKAAADAMARHGGQRMPFAWAARPVFRSDKELDTRAEFSPLFRQDLEKMREEDMFRVLHEYHRTMVKTSTQGKLRFTMVPGAFTASVERYASNYPTVTPSLLPVAPYPDKELAPRREVMSFYPRALQHAHLTYYDFLYVYPRSVNFAAKRVSKSSSARNVLCRIMLLDTDKFALDPNPSGAPLVYGRSNTQRYVSYAETTVSYHTRQPTFNEEVKIALPPTVSRHHHLLFTFFHVAVKEKKKSKTMVRLGHAVLPLAVALTTNRARFHMCVASASAGYDGHDLPPNYLEQIKMEGKTRDTYDKECEQEPLPGLRWLDDGKPLFVVDTRSHSTVRHHDDHLRKFFNACARHDRTTRSDTELCNAIKGLHAMQDATLFGFLPVIFNQLLELLPSSPSNHDDVTANVITYLLYAVGRMPVTAHERSQLVHQYVEHVFKTSYDSTSMRAVHDGLAHQLLPILKDGQTRDSVVLYAWFFLRLISKSMAQFLFETKMHKKPRKKRFPQVACKFDYIRIICSYSQFVSLNLPLSPETLDECVSACDHTFKRRHYPAWVLLSNVTSMLDHPDRNLRQRAIATLRNVLMRHDRQLTASSRAARERVAMLYFPVVHMVTAHSQYLTTSSTAEPRSPLHLSHDATRDLLACFLFVLKNYDPQLIIYYHRTAFSRSFFDVLRHAIDTFHFKGRKEIVAAMMDAPITHQHAIKIIEEGYTTVKRKGSSASGLIDWRTRTRSVVDRQSLSASTPNGSHLGTPRKKTIERSGTSPVPPLEEQSSTTRFRLSTVGSSSALQGALSPQKIDKAVLHAGHFAMESAFVVLEMLELILQDFPDTIEEQDGMNYVAQDSFGILLELLRKEPSDNIVPHVFASIKAFAETYPTVLFNPQVDYNQELCHTALRACSSSLPRLQKYSAVLLYFLLKQNISRMTQDVLVSVSKIAGTLTESADKRLQTAIDKVAELAQANAARSQPGFSSEVEGLMRRVRTVLVNTSKFQQYKSDPETLVDLQWDVANSYSTSPDLRLTWLEKMASNQAESKCWVEAGMCVVHGAAITAQVLAVRDPNSPYRLKDFEAISPNINMERLDALAVEQAKSLTSPLFTTRDWCTWFRVAISCFKRAEYYELVGAKLYNLITPRFEEQNRYTLLSEAHSDLHECYEHILQANKNRMRHFATYYRVKFFGAAFETMDGKEFIYKEPNITPLATVSIRLKSLYTKHLAGKAALEMITDSNDVDASTLDASKAYLQITHVEPYFDEEELAERAFHFHRNYKLQRFIYETPFTASGKARSESVTEQCKRKTILTLANSAFFPALRKRCRLYACPHMCLSPIRVAIDEMTKKLLKIEEIVEASIPNLVMLQLQLQGTLTSQVNAGPMQYAAEFLGKKDQFPKRDIRKLSDLFEKLLEHMRAGVEVHRRLISEEHLELQVQLEAGLDRMSATLEQLIPSIRQKKRRSMRQMPQPKGVSDKVDEPGIHYLNHLLG
ncbi:hypothetical protein PTSG_01105 [Salpingoeca rosetta]|uniref:Uncharacterized protein n=1 Tax=Salpingoeca rosetta (strain ATCC 50818 / BSB-021) TaxID=946362 RepID=F2U0U0_SALR5|nr:uncharacterized protein PTSG_01105 [Salpingoeca rosetta]EGD80514.1 hypothetical protein PTSG_01105 [Salpingoeca rosetta]|eukprot:XP_004997075.1 hypothetical protein PTSG_01105 [Salpingoeca rosetta]